MTYDVFDFPPYANHEMCMTCRGTGEVVVADAGSPDNLSASAEATETCRACGGDGHTPGCGRCQDEAARERQAEDHEDLLKFGVWLP